MEEKYFSVDIEASGPIPGRYSMLAIGACLVGRPEESFYAELKPISTEVVSAAMKVLGRSLDEFREAGSDPRAVMMNFAAWINKTAGNASPVLVAFNATFDWAFINWYFINYVGENPFGIGGVDIKAYYMGREGVSWADTRSSRIPAEFSGSGEHAHHALKDAIEQAAMFERMRAR